MVSSIYSDVVWLNCVSTNRDSLPSMLSTERTNGEFFSVYSCIYYRAYIYWQFPTKPVAPPLDHMCRNTHQRRQFWHQWWCQLVDPINLGSSSLPLFPCTCHFPDVSPSLIWYSPDGLRVRRILVMRWRPVGIGKVVSHTLRCNMQLPVRLCCR